MSSIQDENITMTHAELQLLAQEIAREVLGKVLMGENAAAPHRKKDIITIEGLQVDALAYEATLYGERLALKTREFALLAVLARNAGHVLTREQLIEFAWPDPEAIEDTRTVDVHILRVRYALGGAAYLIETVHGVGYKMRRPQSVR